MTVELPDGWSAKTPGSGLPGGGSGISDPTLSAVERRHELTVREGVDRVRQVHTITTNLLELAAAFGTAALERDLIPGPRINTDGRKLAYASAAFTEAARHAKRIDAITIIDDGEMVSMTRREAIEFAYSYTARLGRIIPAARTEATFEKAELCHGGVSRGHLEPWGRACSTPAVTMDGLCDTCRRRRDRHEAIAAA